MSGFTNEKPNEPSKLRIDNWPEGMSFQPHGIDILHDRNLLFVISHASK